MKYEGYKIGPVIRDIRKDKEMCIRDRDLYLRFSRMAHEIYAEYTDRQEPDGIDECGLDVTGSSSLKGDRCV